ncbi:MAG: DUF805 domain-containing protein [Candidatus Magnetominusculus sp. LBB02]|nr:DUF805 domain-containing protein [Candidatus Magnetominusculus sp. LBB02]
MDWYLAVLKKYADFNGRARRKELWTFVLINFAISIALGVVGGILNFNALGGIYQLAVVVPSIAVSIRRLHDVEKSGWFLLIPIYPIVLAFMEGTKGDNKYGPDPKAAAITTQ